jgi:N-acetylglucosaminyl-diphospho-decaprenol L-rhamnosyltransferase
VNTKRVDLSIVIVNWNTRKLLAQCLQSLEDTVQDSSLEVWVVDNASSDDSVAMIRKCFPQTHIIANSENVGFVRANNQAIARCQGRYVLLLNSDTKALPNALDEMVHFMDTHPNAGVAGARLLNPDGTFQASHSPFPTLWREFLMLSGLGRRLVRPRYPSYGPGVEEGPRKVGYVEGACLLARREAIDQVGELDERIFMYAEEVDWCYRFAQGGWGIWYLPQVTIIHYGGQSSKLRPTHMEAELYRSRVHFFREHYGPVQSQLLMMMICIITPVKWMVHRIVRFLSGGRKGRDVVGWRELHAVLNLDHELS